MAHTHPTALLVDDHEDLRDGVVRLLREDGYAAEAVSDGAAALALLRAGFRPCIIILDLYMPVMDGYQFRREQLADPTLADIPVIVYSETADVVELLGGITAEAYLQKPSDFQTLVALIRKHCGK